ncbi:hypothetical protein P9112_006626 [Eukaryota sp. TZLM1-RC]
MSADHVSPSFQNSRRYSSVDNFLSSGTFRSDEDPSQLRTRLNQVQQELIDLKKRYASDNAYARTRVKEFQLALEERDSIISSLHNDITRLRNSVDNREDIVKKRYLEQISQLNSENRELKNEFYDISELSTKLQHTTNAAECLRKEVGELKTLLRKREEENSNLIVENEELKTNRLKSEDLIKGLLAELKKVKRNSFELSNQKHLLTQFINSSSLFTSVFNNFLVELNGKPQESCRKITLKSVAIGVYAAVVLSKGNRQAVSQIDVTSESLASILNSGQENSRILNQILQLSKGHYLRLGFSSRFTSSNQFKIQDILSSIKSLRSKLLTSEDQVSSLLAQLSEEQSLLSFEKQRTVSLAASLAKSQELANHLSKNIEKLQNEQSNSCPLDKYNELVAVCHDLESQNSKLSSETGQLASNISVMEAEINAQKTVIEQEQESKNTLLNKIKEYESRISQLDTTVTSLEHHTDNLMAKCLGSEEEVAKYSSSNEVLTEQLNERSKMIEELKNELSVVKSRLTSTDQEILNRDQKIKMLSSILDQKTRDLDITNDLLEKKSQELEQAIDMTRSLSQASRKYAKISPSTPQSNVFSTKDSFVSPTDDAYTERIPASNDFKDDSLCEEVEELKRLVKSVDW